ncbi:MAG: hypothetical protein EOO15_24545, partial [Chitinophagaceae bacterium]
MQTVTATTTVHIDVTPQRPFVKTGAQRITSIDLLRGLVMIIMALDHTRDYFHTTGMTQDPTDLQTTTGWLFFT